MADVPIYMQGTATGGLLQNLQSQTASQQAGGGYVPGQGQAPVANPVNQYYDGPMEERRRHQERIDLARAQQAPTQYYDGPAEFRRRTQDRRGQTNAQIEASMIAEAAARASGNRHVPTTVSEPWLSPDELRARTQSLQGRASSGGGGGGGSGSGSVGAGGGGGAGALAGGGGGLFLSGEGAPVGSTPGMLQQNQAPISSTIGYQNPGTAFNTNPGAAFNTNTGSGGQAGVLQMNQASPQSGIDAYRNTTGYQLLNSPGAFEQSPGYQYAMNQAMGQVQEGASARGMLESGAVINAMQKSASGLAQQDYSNWWNRQNQLYGDYQNRLQGLAGGPTGSADAMAAGANMAQANLQTGSNIGSLFGNQGTSGMGGIINTAAAQSGNMINAGQQQATVNAANQATQLAGATIAANQQQQQQQLPRGRF